MPDRELIVRIDSTAGSDGLASLLVYRLGTSFTILATVEKNGDAEVLLSKEQVLTLARTMMAAADGTQDEGPDQHEMGTIPNLLSAYRQLRLRWMFEMFLSFVSIDSYHDQRRSAKLGIWLLTASFATFGSIPLPAPFMVLAGDADMDPIGIPLLAVFILFFLLLGWGAVHHVLRDVVGTGNALLITAIAATSVTVVIAGLAFFGHLAPQCTLFFVIATFVIMFTGHILAATGKQSNNDQVESGD